MTNRVWKMLGLTLSRLIVPGGDLGRTLAVKGIQSFLKLYLCRRFTERRAKERREVLAQGFVIARFMEF
jgi:hypothetical protein